MRTGEEEEQEEEGTYCCSIRPTWILDKDLFRATKEAFRIEICSQHTMEQAIYEEILRDLPWTRGALRKMMVMTHKGSGLWDGQGVITVWNELLHARAFRAANNFYETRRTMPQHPPSRFPAEGKEVEVDTQGMPVINYRYDPWLPMDTKSGSKWGS